MIDIVVSLYADRLHPAETYFRGCIESLEANTRDYRLIVVDDHCDPVARDWLAQFVFDYSLRHPNTMLIRSHKQRWFTRAYNIGLRLVHTERAIVLNADTVLCKGWLEELNDVWAEVSGLAKVGLVGSEIYNPNLPLRWEHAVKPAYVTGHCWMVSMAALEHASLCHGTPGWYLDETEQLNIHIRSDVDLCHRLTDLGYACIKCFRANVGHAGGKSWGYDLPRIMRLTLADVSD